MARVTKKYYNQLIDKLILHAKQYYEENESEISDAEFDSLFAQAKEIEQKHPEWRREDSPIENVMGNPSSVLQKVTHNPPMLSLDKIMDFDELKVYLKKIAKYQKETIITECKHDGLASKLVYDKDGNFIQGATRGDGHIGEDVTEACLLIPSIPRHIDIPKEWNGFEIRGEIFLTKSGLDNINKWLDSINSKERRLKNVRNGASGILRNLNPIMEKCRELVFSAYMVPNAENYGMNTHVDAMLKARELGFKTTNDFVPLKVFNIGDNLFNELQNWFTKANELRSTLDLDIDGMVLKLNNLSLQKQLGEKRSVPNWSIAYKFPQEEKVTKLIGVDWLLGSKGNITPRAILEPVDILGATVSYATLHNIEEIRRLNVKINDTVVVTRRGDVIPKVIRVEESLRTGIEEDIQIPSICPVCGKPVVKTSVMIRCENESCQGRLAGNIEDFITCLEIKDFGTKLIEQLVDNGTLTSQASIFELKVEDISNLDRQGDTSAKKIIKHIEEAKSQPLSHVIAGLGIQNIGSSAGQVLADKYETLDKFKNASYEELLNLADFGERTANNVVTWIKNNQSLVDKLISFNIGMKKEEKHSGSLNGKIFAFTGALSIPRKKMQELITENGGTNSSIKKGIDYLIIGEGAVQEKIDKAKKYGAEVITEEEFNKLL